MGPRQTITENKTVYIQELQRFHLASPLLQVCMIKILKLIHNIDMSLQTFIKMYQRYTSKYFFVVALISQHLYLKFMSFMVNEDTVRHICTPL